MSCLTYLEYSGTVIVGYIGVDKFVRIIMANSIDHLRSFLCPELWQWCQSNDEDKNEDNNLTLRATNEFNTLQQHVAQHPLHYSRLLTSFNKIRILTDNI